jgi:uncharacterized protein YdiU (UPF0061 family)
MPLAPGYRPVPRVTSLGEGFYDVVAPARFPQRRLRYRNQAWAARVGLDTLTDDEWERHLARFEPLLCNLHEPLALRYHGHQFGVYNPALGDGRGFLFAQMLDTGAKTRRILDLGTKGSGPTPWSRGGDGKLTLKGGVREVLATSMLEALGVDTSKSFSLFETGEKLQRGDEPSPTRSSVLVRLSHSHLRFGTFQRLAHERDTPRMRRLLEYVVAQYMPELGVVRDGDGGLPLAFLREVTRRSADLCASWMIAGFVHGVLNTDNMNVTGESFDYGPYRFLPTYDPAFVAAYFDHTGLYAYGRQPSAVLWNVTRLADAVSVLAPSTSFAAVLLEFEPAFAAALQARLCARLGVASRGTDEDAQLFDAAFGFLEASQVGFDRFFFDWYAGSASHARAKASPAGASYAGDSFEVFARALGAYTPTRPELLHTPYFQQRAPETLLIDEIESIWSHIAEVDDWTPFDAKLERIAAMPRLWAVV